MNHITTYLYDNIIDVQILDTGLVLDIRNRTVYSRPIKIYQGIDNPLVISVKNQDQKPVNLNGYTVQVAVQDPSSQIQVASFDITITDAAKGMGKFTIPAAVANGLSQRFYKLTVKTVRQSDNQTRPAYIDQNYSVSLDLEVLDGYYPAS